jgi:hypothetical protein
MVTLYYMRRYVSFMQELLAKAPDSVSLSKEVLEWTLSTTRILNEAAQEIRQGTVTRQTRRAILTKLEKAAEDYRTRVYRVNGFSGKTRVEMAEIKKLMDVSLTVLDETIANNKREDGLFNAYNIINYSADAVSVEELYPMLEGQVAILSAGSLQPKQVVELLDNLFASEMYRDDQGSFMLYPDRDLERFLQKNQLDSAKVADNALLAAMAENGDQRIINADLHGRYHFHADFENASFLTAALEGVREEYPQATDESLADVAALYEKVFNHKAFTGRSGTMFGYEGLGCIYWHMVSKLLLAVQENYQSALREDPNSEETRKLAEYYYRVRDGIGFNKTPQNYGAFPTDPYSHTPKHAGAQQPGMTGQVKEEIITRFGELGLNVVDGFITIKPSLLNSAEFLPQPASFQFEDVSGESKTLVIDGGELAFTYCQVPFVYRKTEGKQVKVTAIQSGETRVSEGSNLPYAICQAIFGRDATVEKVVVEIPASMMR